MEEIWKDITTTLTSTHQHHSSLHEFLASPVYPQPPTPSCDPKAARWSASLAARSKKVAEHHSKPSHQLCGSCPCSQSSPVFASSLFPPSCSSKRESEDDNAGGDRRYMRKMMNRESATRSRARRKAHTSELELELAHLREENAMLRRQQKEICPAAAAVAQLPKKSTLLRSLTAPF